MADNQAENDPQFKHIGLERLDFDPLNPRLPSYIDGNDEDEVIKWMLSDATLVELMGAIGEIGFFLGEPLLVTASEDEQEGRFIVVEGNRRLAAVKLLNDPSLASVRQSVVQDVADNAKHKPRILPVILHPTRADIQPYLGYRHITGIKQWLPLAKARYLKDLQKTTMQGAPAEKQNSMLARMIGSRADYVARLLAGLAVYDAISENFAFFGLDNVNERSIDFSILTTALSYKNISQFIGINDSQDNSLEKLNPSHLKELTSWLFERNLENRTRLGESRNLKVLNRVVASDKAVAAFRNGMPLKEADRLTEAPALIFKQSVMGSRNQLQTARDYSHLIDDGLMKDDSDLLYEIMRMARQLETTLSK